MADRPVTDRRRGAVVGLAVGDALGAAVEFAPPGSFPPVDGYRGGGPHGLGPGEWTDDTSLALALADSILEVGWDLDDQARRYVAWWRTGAYSVNGRCFDIGGTTARALRRFEVVGDAATSGLDDEWSAGNGSIMRLAPVPAAYAVEPLETVVELCVQSSLPTHREPRCLSACAYLGAVLWGLMQGRDRDDVLAPDGEVVGPLRRRGLHPEVDRVAAGSFRTDGTVRGSGYVVDSLEAALWAFAEADGFASAVLAAVNLGDDADTTGAVCGQLAGAYWGYTGIPEEWLTGLARRDLIDATAARLAAR